MSWTRQLGVIRGFVRENLFPAGADRLSLAALILANLIPLGGVLFLGWDAAVIVLIYWSENLVTGFYAILRIVFVGVEQPILHLAKLLVVPFFCIHFGGFCAIHGMFLVALFGIGEGMGSVFPHAPWPGPLVFVQILVSVFQHIWKAMPNVLFWPFLGLTVSHGISFVQNYLGSGEYQNLDAARLMAGPYKRIVVLHVAIIAGGFAVALLGSPRALLLILILLKIGLDLHLHKQSHKSHPKGKRPRAK